MARKTKLSFSSFNQFCSILLFINIHIFDYPDPRLSGLFRVVPTSPDNRGSTVLLFLLLIYLFFGTMHGIKEHTSFDNLLRMLTGAHLMGS